MRRTASLWMALLLVWSLMLPAAAETAAAATLRLPGVEISGSPNRPRISVRCGIETSSARGSSGTSPTR